MGALQIIFFPGGFPEWQRLWNEEDLVKSVTLHNCVSLGKSFDLYEIRFLYLKDKFLISIYLSTYMKHLMQCASCIGIWINEDWATVDSPVLRSTVLHLLKTVHCAFSYESEVLDWVTLLEAFQWCGPPHTTKTELSGHMGGSLSLCLGGSSSWWMTSHLVTLSWTGMRQRASPPVSLGKNKLSVLCVENATYMRQDSGILT